MSEDGFIMAESELNYEPKNIFLTGGAGAYSFLSDIDIDPSYWRADNADENQSNLILMKTARSTINDWVFFDFSAEMIISFEWYHYYLPCTLHYILISPHLTSIYVLPVFLNIPTIPNAYLPTYLPSAHLPILNLQRSYHNIMSATSK